MLKRETNDHSPPLQFAVPVEACDLPHDRSGFIHTWINGQTARVGRFTTPPQSFKWNA
jgi:hypothetical protein